MKIRPVRIIGFAVLAALLFCYAVIYRAAVQARHLRTCERLNVELADEGKFLTEEDIKEYIIKYYGTYMGRRLDSLNLFRIEKALRTRHAVRECQAWLCDDGTLSVRIYQRRPVVRFQKGSNGFYADASGFLFPLQRRHTVNVPVIEGNIPLEDKDWIRGALEMINYIEESRIWRGNIVQASVDRGGEICLVPREGPEKFLIGRPKGIKEKFARMEEYYRSVKPLDKNYKIINVKYTDQIICK